MTTMREQQRQSGPYTWGSCPCGKRGYPDRRSARVAGRQLGAAGPWWHLTSQDALRAERWRSHDAGGQP